MQNNGHDLDTYSIFQDWTQGTSVTDLAKKYHIGASRVSDVCRMYAGMGMGEISLSDPLRLFPQSMFTAYNPSVLVTRKGLAVFDEMRRDDQIKAALKFKKHAVLATGWEVVSPEGKPPDWEVTKFVNDQLNLMAGTLTGSIIEIMTALDYGFSVTEIILKQTDDNKIGLAALKTRDPHSFNFVTDEFGNLLPDGVQQETPTGIKNMPENKFVIYSYQKEFGNPYGTSDLESAYRAWWTKDNSYKWLAMYLERFGIPPLFMFYDPKAFTATQQTQLQTVLENLQASTVGLVPRTKKDSLEPWSPEIATQVSSVFIPSLAMFNQDMSRALLMPGLLGMTPDSATGSFARAKVHFDVFSMVVEYLRSEITETVMNEQVVRPLVDLNFPVEDDDYPEFRLMPLSDEIRVELLKTWSEMVGAGVVLSTLEDEQHIRKITEFPDRAEEDEPLNPPELPEDDEDDEGGGEDDLPEDDSDEEDGQDSEEDDE